MKVVIDCDPGDDDAQVIMMALASPDVEILGITTVTGNGRIDDVTSNALRVLTTAERLDIPVYQGCGKPLVSPPTYESRFHGKDAFGDFPFPSLPNCSPLQPEHAVLRLLELSRKFEGELHLLAIGPLTNVAMAIRLDPQFGHRLKSCRIMGGNYSGQGNIVAHAEFNFYHDSHAAHIAIKDLGCPITITCWELCKKHHVPREWFEEDLLGKDSACTALIRNIETHRKKKPDFYRFCDQLAAAELFWDGLVTSAEEVPARVVPSGETRGLLVLDHRERERVGPEFVMLRFVKELKMDTFLQKLKHAIHSLP